MANKIQIPQEYVGYFTAIWQRVYEEFSTAPFPQEVAGYPYDMDEYFKCLYYPHPEYLDIVNGGKFDFVPFVEEQVPTFTVPQSNKAMIGFSGGKDSVATIFRLREMGYEVVGLHLLGLNKMYPNEIIATRAMAEKIGVPLVEVEVKQLGKADFPDNPAKNQLITAIMTDYAIKHGFSTVAMGTHQVDALATSNIYFDWSDPQETLHAVEAFIQRRFPQFKYLTVLANYTDAYKTIIDAGRGELIYDIISCILPLRYRESRRKANEVKFNIEIKPNRCGSCQKCVTEYMNLMALGFVPRNEEFIAHSIKKWQEKNNEVYGITRKITDMHELFPLWLDVELTGKTVEELLPRK